MTDLLLKFDQFSNAFLKITTKDSRLIDFQLNKYQKRVLEVIERLQSQNKPVRIIILKARQMGISTLSAGYIYFKTATNFYTKSMLVAHDADSTNNLFNMVKRYYDFCPDKIKPLKKYSNRRELVFENGDENSRLSNPGLLSSVEVDTANNTNAGRSGTIHHLHISELAFWANANLPLTGLLQTVPNNPETSIIIESTANGIDGDGKVFYEMWQKAEKGLSDFVPIFIPWYENDEYRLKPTELIKTKNEEMIASQFKLNDAQVYWRRWKINNDLNGDEMLFKQEFPSTAEEAFILSGRPVFDLASIQKQIHLLEGKENLFPEPEPDMVYAVGADVAEGLEEGDYSTAFVIDKNFKQCGKFKAHVDPDLFAIELVNMAKKFNNALLAPEINNMGYAVLSKIKDLGHSNIYQREEADTHEEKISRRLGWATTVKSKHLMLSEFIAAFRDESIQIKDVELLKEMLTLSYEPDGNVNLNGKDLVVSACIALQALKQTPNVINYKAFVPPEGVDKIIKPMTFTERMKQRAKKSDGYYD